MIGERNGGRREKRVAGGEVGSQSTTTKSFGGAMFKRGGPYSHMGWWDV